MALSAQALTLTLTVSMKYIVWGRGQAHTKTMKQYTKLRIHTSALRPGFCGDNLLEDEASSEESF